MPVYNGEKHLDAAIKSILDQSFADFEFLIMDDGSTDRTPQILEFYAKKDPRIRLFRQQNSGIVKSLNTLVAHAKSDLIARLDADDLAYPQRLQAQYEHMERHPKTVLLGALCAVCDENGKITSVSDSFAEDFINRWFLIFNCPFIHSSVMFRKTVFNACQGYLQSEYPAEDYGLWTRFKKHGAIENLKQVSGAYRYGTAGITTKNFHKQITARDRLNRTNFEDLYSTGEIPDPTKIDEALRHYPLDRHRKEIFGKLACLTGCFLVEKGETRRALQFFKWSFLISKKRLDALANLLLARFRTALYISIDIFVNVRTAKPQIRWFRQRQAK
jgi:glycosyltransferase involved in cell wall biosynthesis